MQVVVVTDDGGRDELASHGVQADLVVDWTTTVPAPGRKTDCCIDLLFNHTPERISALQQLGSPVVIINSVTATLEGLPDNFVRINGWPGFLQRPLVEAATKNESMKTRAEEILSGFHKSTEWVADQPGFVTATVISMIINEAYFAAGENVGTKEDIDTAMKLGTNYPFGPFEWAGKIGITRIHQLLSALAATNSRYQPAALLVKEAITR